MPEKMVHLMVLAFLFLFSCGNEEVGSDPIIDEVEETIENFSFYRKNNPDLIQDVHLDQHDHVFSGTLPEGARIKELIASFDLCQGCIATINGEIQESGLTENDFSKSVIYSIENQEGQIEEFVVKLIYEIDLPVLEITTLNGQGIYSKEEYVEAFIKVDGKDLFESLEGHIKIRGRGNSTWGLHPKKPYQIKFDEKVEMLGLPKDKRWLLLAEYSDKTFLRNQMAWELGYQSILEYTTRAEYAEVILNGEEQGLYLISQKVEESSNRVNIGDEGFLLEIDQLERLDDDDIYFYTDQFLLNIKEPDLTEKGVEFEWIQQYVTNFENVLYGSQFKHPTVGFRKYIDEQTVADWFIINEIAKNVDAKWFASIFMYVVPGEKIKFGPIWDFDLGFGNVNYADSEYPEGWWVRENPWIKRMLEDSAFKSLVKERYAYFRAFEEDLYSMMDEKISYMAEAQEKNDKIWGTIGMWVWPNPEVFPNYEGEVDYVKQWFKLRLAWMDANINNL